MNLMLATLTAKDRFDAFQADADAERLAAHLPARRGPIGLRTAGTCSAG